MSRTQDRPNLENTRRRPEAFHASCLRDEMNELLDRIMELTALRPNRTNQLYPVPTSTKSDPFNE